MRLIAVVLLSFLLAASGALAGVATRQAREIAPTVILISVDGWRWDYHTKYSAPAIRSLMARGVRAEGLIPAFPSKTFPNHYSIVTGLYPGRHGIVANTVRDVPTGRTLSMSNRHEVQDAMWWGGVPIWVSAERAGQRTSALFWPGSEAPIGGARPTYWAPYDDDLPPEVRVDRALEHLDRPAGGRPTFMALYFSDVDSAGHDDGPDSLAVRRAVRRVDRWIARLLNGLERRRLRDAVNIILVSDHGMAETRRDRIVFVDDYIAPADADIVDLNPTLGLFPAKGKDAAVFAALQGAHPRLRVYRREETPPAWHYRDHPRVPPVVGVVDEGWEIMRRGNLRDWVIRHARGAGGAHGYDPVTSPSMRGLFVAAGPAFRQGVVVPAFENVHIYPALARILGVAPAPNDGDPAISAAWFR